MHNPGELSYVVLDVPQPQASAVMAIRRAHSDLFRAALPVEVTLTDSLDPTQGANEAFAALDGVAAVTPPIETSFAGAHRFPSSDTFVLRVADEEAFVTLRDRIIGTGIKFEPPSGYDFVPHCTLRTRSPVSPEEVEQLVRTDIPGQMTLETLSVYTLTRATTPAGADCQLRHRVRLAGHSE